jgi:cell division septation protein DedD
MIKHPIPLLLICLLAFATFATAQRSIDASYRCEVKGRVTEGDQPVRGVVVSVENQTTKKRWQTTTDQNGDFKIDGLPPGKYRITSVALGRWERTIRDIEIGPLMKREVKIAVPLRPTITAPDRTAAAVGADEKIEIAKIPIRVATPTPAPTAPPPAASPTPAASVAPPAPTPDATPATAPAPASIDSIVDQLDFGNIAFNTPGEAKLGEAFSVELKLSPTKELAEVVKSIGEPGAVESARIRISDFMEARLIGSGFEITPVTSERQVVIKIEDTTWRWDVRPKDSGVQFLNLTVNAIIEDEGKERLRSVTTFKREIRINVSFADRVTDFTKNNWQWLWATIVVPVGAWLWKRRKGKEEKES